MQHLESCDKKPGYGRITIWAMITNKNGHPVRKPFVNNGKVHTGKHINGGCAETYLCAWASKNLSCILWK